MANKTIPDLTAGAAVAAADLFEASQSAASVKVTGTQLKTFIAGAKASWTPRLAIGGSSTGITYTAQNGSWQRIGDVVVVSLRIILSSRGGLSGAVTIEDLPVTAGQNGASSIQIGAFATSYTNVCRVNNATTTILLYNAVGGSLAATDITDSSSFYVTATYFA